MKIKVLSKKVTITNEKGKENTFYRYFAPVMIHVVENGEDIGEQRKSLSVHFTKDAMKQLPSEKVFAVIETSDCFLPFVYEVKKDEDGNDVYPEIWIRKIDGYKEIELKKQTNTCVPLIDEEDTEPVEIIG